MTVMHSHVHTCSHANNHAHTSKYLKKKNLYFVKLVILAIMRLKQEGCELKDSPGYPMNVSKT